MQLLKSLIFAAAVSAQAEVFLIRHAEKPASGNGLTAQGQQRAQCLRNVFGASSNYNIQYIMAQMPQPDGTQQRPYDTVEPLAQDLGITVDTSCQRDDSACVQNVVDNYSGPGNILICWEHKQLSNIVLALGASSAPTYPSTNFNIIWNDPFDYSNGVTSMGNECCPGLDSC